MLVSTRAVGCYPASLVNLSGSLTKKCSSYHH